MKFYFLRIVTEFILMYELPEYDSDFSAFFVRLLYTHTKVEYSSIHLMSIDRNNRK